ncbi:hypothetical protein BTU61_03725 [Streptococcus lactarius]|uniref:Uncharacterized protein n=1 Tax=Streptococcus lactarius TaxID=684066 RepID=A0A9X0WND0_9STRE|nr:hypothetical protein [Streptococcus lactarius]
MGIVAESYPALKRLYSLLKSNRRNSVYAFFAKTFAYHAIINFFHIFCKGFLKKLFIFFKKPRTTSLVFIISNVNELAVFIEESSELKYFLKNF